MNAMQIRYARIAELPSGERAAVAWLSAEERAAHAAMRATARRSTWLAGRILAKKLLLETASTTGPYIAGCQPTELQIESRSINPGHGERPALFVNGVAVPCAISVSHTASGVLAAVSLDADISLGVDLVEPAESSQALRWTFSPGELDWLADSPRNRPEQLWALKEALYKACQRGEGFSPQNIETVPGQLPSYPRFAAQDLRQLQSWRVDGHFAALAVVLARPAAATNMELPSLTARAA
jgi:4'-phosphopantetheinyl transferase